MSAILNHSKIGGKINSEALNNLFYEDINKRKALDDDIESTPYKQLNNDSNNSDRPSLLSGLTLKY